MVLEQTARRISQSNEELQIPLFTSLLDLYPLLALLAVVRPWVLSRCGHICELLPFVRDVHVTLTGLAQIEQWTGWLIDTRSRSHFRKNMPDNTAAVYHACRESGCRLSSSVHNRSTAWVEM